MAHGRGHGASTPKATPVTAAVSRRVKPGAEAQFEEWASDVTSVASSFPGHLGAGLIRPAEPGGEHTIIYRFDTQEHFDAWQASDERALWLEASRDFVEGEPRVEKATGLEFWFQDPSSSSSLSLTRWKQALLTWIGLYPTALLLAYTIGVLLAQWPVPARSAITSGVTVVLMTWVVMPTITRIVHRRMGRDANR